MDVEKIAMFAGVGFAIAVGLFVLWGPSPKPRKKGNVSPQVKLDAKKVEPIDKIPDDFLLFFF